MKEHSDLKQPSMSFISISSENSHLTCIQNIFIWYPHKYNLFQAIIFFFDIQLLLWFTSVFTVAFIASFFLCYANKNSILGLSFEKCKTAAISLIILFYNINSIYRDSPFYRFEYHSYNNLIFKVLKSFKVLKFDF